MRGGREGEREKDGERKWGEGNRESEMEGQRDGWERAGTQDEMQRLHKTLTCIHAVVHLVVTGLSIFTQVAWGWGFWELEGRWFITWPPVWPKNCRGRTTLKLIL